MQSEFTIFKNGSVSNEHKMGKIQSKLIENRAEQLSLCATYHSFRKNVALQQILTKFGSNEKSLICSHVSVFAPKMFFPKLVDRPISFAVRKRSGILQCDAAHSVNIGGLKLLHACVTVLL